MTDGKAAMDPATLIVAGVSAEAKRYPCMGCGEFELLEVLDEKGKPQFPLGVHAPIVVVTPAGVQAAVPVFAHPTKRCMGTPLYNLLYGKEKAGETDAEESEPEPTPIRHRRAKGEDAATEISGNPEVASVVAAGLD